MKKIVLFFVIIVSINASAQIAKYHRVLMQGDEQLAQKLISLGITIDHSEKGEGGLIAEISELEVNILKQNNIKHSILIEDVTNYYVERNKQDVMNKILAPQDCNKSNLQKPTYFHLGSMGGYFTFNEVVQILDSMVLLYPNLITVKQPLSPLSHQGRTIWQVKISDNPNTDEAEPEVLYTSLHHAREAASVSQLIFYMWYLLENYATNPDIKATLDGTELYFIPVVNPDGYVYNQTISPNGGGMWRKNRRTNGGGSFGVDLNRNYGYNWGFDNSGSSPTSTSDTYRGPSAFSEPETQAIRNFCNTRTFVNALNAHTYGNLLIYPWGYQLGLYTPDSATYVNWGVLLTQDSRFLYGTADQTVNYVTNGSSDDWMYGEQGTKPKILAMTPEAGSAADGFWPASSRILDICKATFTQNYNLAKLSGKYARVLDKQDKFLSNSGYLKYRIKRLGLGTGSFTVSINPIGTELSAVGAPKIYPSLNLNQEVLDSISYTANFLLSPGQVIKYKLEINNGDYIYHDTISKVYGNPITLLYDPGNSTVTNFTTTGTWGLSTTKFNSAPSSITESPAGNYSGNQLKTITTASNIAITNAIYAHLQFFTRFEMEKAGDDAQIFISTNNGTSWSPLCGKYETPPVTFGGTNPIYDGIQNEWVMEDFDLSAYIGQSIRLRFQFQTDPSVNKDGFYFDDLLIRKLAPAPPASVNNQIIVMDNIRIYPNPASAFINISNPDEIDITVSISNVLGQKVLQDKNTNERELAISTSELPNGVYFVKLKHNGIEEIKKIVKD
ncbi:MAG: immune inhibitor A [Sphingobacteriaceae bacterium]|nr:immune inhibitor A [Sphingobacteriaceae bacterium]